MKSLIVIFALIGSVASYAAQTSSTEVKSLLAAGKPNLHEGNFEIGGGFTVANAKYEGQSSMSMFQISPKLEYFFMDQFSLGGTLAYSSTSGSDSSNSTSIGPSATYYFYTADQFAFYGAQALAFAKYSGDSKTYTSGMTSLGTKFFFAPQAAFGVGLNYSYRIGNDNKYDIFGMAGTFSFYY